MSNPPRDSIIRIKSPFRLLRTFSWLLLTISATSIALFSLRYALPHIPAPARLTNVTTRRVALSIHAVSAAIALLAGPWQFVTSIRNRHPHLHRALGRCYALAVLIGWCASLPIALHAQTGPIASAGFLCLGLCWIATTATAIWKIKHGDIPAHRRWMIRSYALTTAAITLRIYLLIILTQNIPFIPAYRTISWLCWLPNFLLAEFIFRKNNKTALGS